MYPGVTTCELDELAAQTAAYMATQHRKLVKFWRFWHVHCQHLNKCPITQSDHNTRRTSCDLAFFVQILCMLFPKRRHRDTRDGFELIYELPLRIVGVTFVHMEDSRAGLSAEVRNNPEFFEIQAEIYTFCSDSTLRCLANVSLLIILILPSFLVRVCFLADMSLLAARISVSNLHKSTPDAFSKTIEKLFNYVLPQTGERSPLISEDVYKIVMEVIHCRVRCNAAKYIIPLHCRQYYFIPERQENLFHAINTSLLE